MRVGILTYHRAHNYGAVLQLFGLYSYLQSRGDTVYVIDYWPQYRSGQYDLISTKLYKNSQLSRKYKILHFIKEVLVFPEKLVKWGKFERFIDTFRMTESKPEILNALRLDFVVLGSDQIWRYNKFGFDPYYFGKFNTDAIKVSYAASMGVEEVGEQADNELKVLLKNVDSISVRELSLQEKLEKLNVANVSQVLDPVFLLKKSDWERCFPNIKRQTNTKYLLFYNLLNDQESKTIAQALCKKNSWKLVEIQGDVKAFRWLKGVKTTTGPIDFLKLVYNAEFVVTSSFHGVAFSILFNKQFLASGFGKNSTRVMSILKLLSIQNRHIKGEKQMSIKPIDYEAVNFRLAELVGDSKAFIERTISKKS